MTLKGGGNRIPPYFSEKLAGILRIAPVWRSLRMTLKGGGNRIPPYIPKMPAVILTVAPDRRSLRMTVVGQSGGNGIPPTFTDLAKTKWRD
jgi:galactokinase/mevalonate kinase-like predicted kinase